MQLKTNRNLCFYCVNCCLITVNTKKDNAYRHPISNDIKQKWQRFYWQLDCLPSILKKMHRKFQGNRPISTKVIVAFQRLDASDSQFDIQSEGQQNKNCGLQLSTISRPESGPFLLFQVCFKFLQVFAPYHPPFYHILIYSHDGLTVWCLQLISILCY